MKILIVKLSSLGDIIHSLPALNAIKACYPNAVIDWLITDGFTQTLEGQPVNQIHSIPRKSLGALIKKAFALRKENYDIVIDLQGLLKTALASRIAGRKDVYGRQKTREKPACLFYTHLVEISNNINIIEQNLKLVEAFLGKDQVEVNFGLRVKSEINPNNICVIPGTTWESKFWPTEHWIELLKKFPNHKIHLLGTKADLEILEPIHQAIKNSEIITNKKLRELGDFFGTMQYIIGVDTGPMHIAAAACYGLNTKPHILGIYGPTSGARTGPYGFDYISFDEISQGKASHKRSIQEDKASMSQISPIMVYQKLSSI